MTAMIHYISYLLHYHDCVIVPGLGGFVVNRQTAHVNENQHLFVPPSKEVGFNRSLSHNDGLLANHVAQAEGLSYPEALVCIEAFVAKLQTAIVSGQLVEMGSIGSFRGDAIGNLLFTPKETNTFLPDAFGLSSFRFEPVGYRHMVRMGSRRVALTKSLPKKSLQYWTGVAALLTGFFFLATYDLNTPSVSQANLADAFMWKQEAVKSVADVKQAVISETEIYEEKSVDFSNKKYHLIAASLKNPNSAEFIKNELYNDGFVNSSVLHDGKGHYRVALQSYDYLEDAVQEMNQFRKETRFASVWVFKKK